MIYNTEKDLQIDLSEIVASETSSGSYRFFRREVPIGECIPDLVVVNYYYLPKLTKFPNSWNSKHSYIIWLLKKWNNLSLSEISTFMYESEERILPILSQLVKFDLIIDDNNIFNLSKRVSLIHAEVITYEAKLTRWKEALDQCVRYSSFSDKTYVVMDKDGVPLDKLIIEKFETKNIGLCIINNNKLEVIVKPKQNLELSFEREYLVFSTLIPKRQMLWSIRNSENAFCHA